MRYRLSHSTLDTLNRCERKYQLERLLVSGDREESEHLSFGHAFGAGVASYLSDQDAEKALFKAWLAYWPEVETEKKSQAICFLALQNAFRVLDDILQEYELVYFEGKPACELSFRLNIDEDYYFVGYVDAVLRHRYHGVYVVFEVKTTGLALLDLAPAYKHSGQALGYSIALDRIVGHELSSYGVLYFVAQLGKDINSPTKIHVLPFDKTLLDRLNWFVTLGLDVKHLHEMQELGIYPKRYTACLSFNKPCRHFGTCHLHSLDTPKVIEPDEVDYQFVYDLEELVADHLRRIAEGSHLNKGVTIEGQARVVECSTPQLGCEIPDVDSLPVRTIPFQETSPEAKELDDELQKLVSMF